MTAILWKDNALYCDSLVERNGHWYNVCDKVITISLPCKLVSKGVMPDGERYDDWIVGFTYSGALTPAVAFMQRLAVETEEMLLHPEDPDYSTLHVMDTAIRVVKGLKLDNFENSFTLLVVGVCYNYIISYEGNDDGLSVERVGKERMRTLGSGQSAITELHNRHEGNVDPVRLMHHAFDLESSCGGWIWKYEVLPRKGTPSGYVLTRTALYTAPSVESREAARILYTHPVTPLLILNPEHQDGKTYRKLHPLPKPKPKRKPKQTQTPPTVKRRP